MGEVKKFGESLNWGVHLQICNGEMDLRVNDYRRK